MSEANNHPLERLNATDHCDNLISSLKRASGCLPGSFDRLRTVLCRLRKIPIEFALKETSS